MTRVLATLAIALSVLVVHSAAVAAPRRESKRAYKPASQRQRAADAQPSQAADAAAGDAQAPAAGGTYEQELQAAKEQRDKELQAAATEETDRRKLEQKKQKIFAQYAAIAAALRDKYEASQPTDAANAKPPAGKYRTRAKPAAPQAGAPGNDAPKARERGKKGRDPVNALAEAQKNLDEENARHQAKMDQLNTQLEQAQSANNPREVRRVQKAIDKENNSYTARKTILERKVRDLGGTTTPAAPATE